MIDHILRSKPHNEKYLNRYIKFINWCAKINEGKIWKITRRNFSHIGLENHHICPAAKDLFPQYKNFKKYPWNKITLTSRQHFIAHWMLWKAYGKSQTLAFMYFTSNNKFLKRNTKVTSKVYEKLKIDFIVVQKNKIHHSGWKHTEESKNKMKGPRPHFKPNLYKESIERGVKKAKETKSKNKEYYRNISIQNAKKGADARRGKSQTAYQKQRASEANLGKIVSKETGNKISESKIISITVKFIDGSTLFFKRREELGIFLGKSGSLGAKLANPKFHHLLEKYNIDKIIYDQEHKTS